MDGFAATMLSLKEAGFIWPLEAAPGEISESGSENEAPLPATERLEERRCDLTDKIVTYARNSP